MRSFATLSVLGMLLVLGSSSRAPTPFVAAALLSLRATPVALDSEDAGRAEAGELLYLGGWSLTGNSRWFGGLSGVRLVHDTVFAVSDVGGLVRFTLPAKGTARGSIGPIDPYCDGKRVRLGRDLEGLATDGRSLWVSSERQNAICRIDATGRATSGTKPAAMAGWPRLFGAETLLRLRDGRFMAIAEGGGYPVLVFDRDPTLPAAEVRRLAYRPPAGFSPTDAAELPDGRIVVLNRRFGLFGFRNALVLFDGIPERGVAQGRTIAVLAPPLITENFEGIDATSDNGRTVLTLVSDNNFSRWQQTLLLRFAFD